MTSHKSWRVTFITIGIFVIAALIIVRLFYLQVINGKFYQSQALGQQTGFSEVQGDRGLVYFANSKETRGQSASGEIKSLAINKETWTVYAVPKNIVDKDVFAKEVGTSLGITKEFLLEKLKESDLRDRDHWR